MTLTPFAEYLLSQRPNLTDEIVHPRFQLATKEAMRYASLASGGTILLITGASGSGKSTLLRVMTRFFTEKVFKDVDDTQLPLIGMTAGTSNDGKVRMKYVLNALLSDLGHPSFDQRKIEIAGGYRPITRTDESSQLSMVRHGLNVNKTRILLIDEAQFLTENRNPDLRGGILESMKSLVTSSTDLVLCGGFSLLVELDSLKAHLASRVITIVVDRYRETDSDLVAWRKIVAAISKSPKIRLRDPDVLIRNSEQLLVETLGVIGVLERRVLQMAMSGPLVTQNSITATRPSKKKIAIMQADIHLGESHLADVYISTRPKGADSAAPADGERPKRGGQEREVKKPRKTRHPPFHRNATRSVPKVNA
ncbi:AAA family ATPase [Silanimonas sp.]|uniref:AAA family ATPase n=1 Tax=Silanimonas sp. TaxID=1929290 RepID=UPI0022BBFA75|nr:AAA family ATPase [Silanimonas sp.]MCZ8064180.1 AAA family ATPase [Silanimonas sp.]